MAKNPIAKQYEAKYFSFDFFTIDIIQVQATIPVTKAKANPIPNGKKSISVVSKAPSLMSFAIFPNINGTTIKNEKRAAFSLSIPKRTEVEIVAPDLDIPGNMAMA